MKQTFPELAEMCGKYPVMQQKRQWSLTVDLNAHMNLFPGDLFQEIPTKDSLQGSG